MKKLLYGIAAVALVLAVGAVLIYNTPAGQDGLFRQAAQTLIGQTPTVPNGMRVLVCGSASPLGNDLSRAQACIAVLTPEHFFLFDVGARSPQRLNQARVPMNRLTA